MLKRHLKRFERLENSPADKLVQQGIKLSKRFEFLEVGNKRIEIAITDKITSEELAEAPASIGYFFLCPYCGMENDPGAQHCAYCKQNLKTKFAEDYQKTSKLLQRCSACGATNQSDRRNCWVCGRDLPAAANKPAAPENSENIITLNIDGKIYRSSDKFLPPDIYALMQRIRKEGYSSKIIDDWINAKNETADLKKEGIESRITAVRQGLTWRLIALAIFLLFMFFQMSSCFFRSIH